MVNGESLHQRHSSRFEPTQKNRVIDVPHRILISPNDGNRHDDRKFFFKRYSCGHVESGLIQPITIGQSFGNVFLGHVADVFAQKGFDL